MLQNIRILVGPIPQETGNLKEDNKNLRLFLERLLRGIETNFDRLDNTVDKLEKGERK